MATATSSSLAALKKAFSAGEQKRARSARITETILDYKLAVDLDPGFATAYARLGAVYQGAQEWELARQNTGHAFAIREHASERERLYIASHYYGNVTDELDRAVQVYELWRQVYPRDIIPPNNLAAIYNRSGATGESDRRRARCVQVCPRQRILPAQPDAGSAKRREIRGIQIGV